MWLHVRSDDVPYRFQGPNSTITDLALDERRESRHNVHDLHRGTLAYKEKKIAGAERVFCSFDERLCTRCNALAAP